jgi:hypothetical protein
MGALHNPWGLECTISQTAKLFVLGIPGRNTYENDVMWHHDMSGIQEGYWCRLRILLKL